MVDKKSPYYVKSEFEQGFYRTEDSTTFARELKVSGNEEDHVKYTAVFTKKEVM